MNQLKSISFSSPLEYPGFLIWQKANVWEKYINDILKQLHITQSEIFQLISLATLLRQHDEVRQIDLVSFTGASPMSVSKILKILEKRDLITRTTGVDTRSKALGITEVGMRMLIDSTHLLFEANKTFFSEENLEQFKHYLQNIQ
jgi:DNA-binding MarR family transcriptional regulator